MTDRISRREALALIVLTEGLPAPREIGFTDDKGRVSIYLDCVADLYAWLPYFGLTEAQEE
jgi:hypothetical protein